jgi:ribonuclease T1
VRKGFFKLVLTSFLLVLTMVSGGVQAKEWTAPSAIDATVALNELPPQGIEIYRLIHQGGPFLYEKDGVVFGNRERLLPAQKRGYYREYTVKTPRSSNRGARRIVCGGPAAAPDTCFYTADHYASFRKIVP